MRKMDAAAATVLALSITLTASPAAANAMPATISPGDRIDYVTDAGAGSFCTTGYVYTGTNGHAYAITAGHCQTDAPGRVVEEASGLSGRFVNAVVAPPRSGGPDYGLIDFGPHVVSRTSSETVTFTAAQPPPAVRIGQTVCHFGVSSGQHCGTVAYSYGDEQFMTEDMPASVPGDSGGPVWVTDDYGDAHIIGIWLGEKTSADSSRRHGRFARPARRAGHPHLSHHTTGQVGHTRSTRSRGGATPSTSQVKHRVAAGPPPSTSIRNRSESIGPV